MSEFCQMSLNNHFKFGYDGEFFVERNGIDQEFCVQYGKCEEPVMDWRYHCTQSAKQISEIYAGKPIYVCLSGGIDSEVVARSFLSANIRPKIIIIRHANDFNLHDFCWAVGFCETEGLDYEFFDLDLIEFWESGEVYEYAKVAHGISPQMCTLLKIMQHVHDLGGVAVLGALEREFRYSKKYNSWGLTELENFACLYRYVIKTKINVVPSFFNWSPEILLSYMNDHLLNQIMKNTGKPYSRTSHAKSEIYSRYWPLQKRQKYAGYEKLIEYNKKHRSQLESIHSEYTSSIFTPVNVLRRFLEPKINS